MNSQGNKRTTKEGSSGLTFQNISPLKNRSWPRLSSAKGQYRTVPEPLPDSKHNFVTVLDGDKVPRDDDYEDPELQLLKEWPSMKILPARPIKESEYADTRYLKDMMDVPLLLHAKTSVPTERQSWSVGMRRREEVDKPTSRDVRSQRCTGARSTKVNKTPLPPPRPPVTLPKKYQPLPPEPESSALFPQRHTLPEAQRGPRQMSLKGFYEVLGAEKDSHHPIKPKPSQPLQNQNTQKSPPAITSFPGMPSKHSTQDRVRTVKHMDPTGIMQSCPPQRCHSPVSHSSPKSVLSYENTSRGKPTPTRSDGKDIQQNEWYIGEYSRQAVEEALMKESKDGTFLVRDCSTKSDTEPYVLVVFYGNKVYNVKIRFLERNQQFALGTGLRGTEKFDSVEDIIEHYKYFPIVLIDGKDKAGAHREQCYLTQPLALASHFRP